MNQLYPIIRRVRRPLITVDAAPMPVIAGIEPVQPATLPAIESLAPVAPVKSSHEKATKGHAR